MTSLKLVSDGMRLEWCGVGTTEPLFFPQYQSRYRKSTWLSWKCNGALTRG